jgi:hypothetical protein
MILFSYLNDFSYFSLKIVPKFAGHGQNRSKMKGDVDDFIDFSYFIFKLGSSLIK